MALLYIQDKVGSVTRPVKELKRFMRVPLKADEKRTLRFELTISELAFWYLDMQYGVEPGELNLWVAGYSQCAR